MCALHHVLRATDAETNESQTLVPRGLPTGRGDKRVNKQAPSLLWWLQGRCGGERGTAEAVSGGSGWTRIWALMDKQVLALTAEGEEAFRRAAALRGTALKHLELCVGGGGGVGGER